MAPRAAIAVVIPCYNMARTVADTVASVRAQTHAAAEIVVVDDGSTDAATERVLTGLAADDVRVVRVPHGGVARARNHGVSLTRSPLIVLVDADDLLHEDYLARMAAAMDGKPAIDFVSCALQAFEGGSYTWTPPALTVIGTLTRGSVHISTMLRRRLWDAVGGFDPELPAYEDLDFWLRALRLGFEGEILAEPLLQYRVGSDSRYRRGIEAPAYRETMTRIFDKHREVIDAHGLDVLAEKDAFLVGLKQYQQELRSTRARLLSAIAAADDEAAAAPVSPGPEAPESGGGLILVYHRVAALSPDTHHLCVDPSRFRQHLRYLREHCHVMPLLDLCLAARRGTLPPRAVAVTLDDGYLDALTTAAPILADQRLPATFFVNTERLDAPHEAWHDVVERLIPSIDARLALHGPLMAAGIEERRRLLAEIPGWGDADAHPRRERRVLLGAEIAALSRMPECEVGSHSAHHLQMPLHSTDVQRRELDDARHALEALTGQTVLAFAYPFGEHDPAVEASVRAARHAVAVTAEPGLVNASTNWLRAPRLEIGDLGAAAFATVVEAAFGGEAVDARLAREWTDNDRRARAEIDGGVLTLSSRPRFLIVDPSSRCNARCVMCPVSFRPPGETGSDLPADAFDRLTPLMPTASHINLFSTGEPTIARDILHIIDEARRLAGPHSEVWLSTNGKHLSEAVVGALAGPRLGLQFSVDGGTQDVFEAIRRGIGFDELHRSLALAARARARTGHPRLRFSSTMSKRNIADLSNIFTLAAQYGVERVLFYEEDPEVAEEEPFILDADDRPVFDRQLPAILATGVPFTNGLVFRGRQGLRALRPAAPADPPPVRCSAPWNVFHARADGTVRTCCTLRTSMGDLRTHTVDEIWNGAEYTSLRRAFVEQRGIPGTCYLCTDPLRTWGVEP